MRWVRQLEEDTGAVSIGETGKDKEGGAAGGVLPNFFLGSYEEALRFAQRELRVLCVILLSEEHDDVPGFKRNVLTNLEVVQTLTENNFIVWGGDVSERDAYQASLKLSTTSYPFVAFVSLQPHPSTRSNSSSTTSQLSVVSRITPLSPAALITHITHTVLPRTTPFIQRLKSAEQARVRERQLREEQDRALEEAMRRDGERIRAIREREKAEREKEREEEERRQAKAEEGERRERRRVEKETWRRYARRALVPAEPARGVRVTVRISSGQRKTRTFAPSDSVEAVYIWTETLSIPPSQSPADDPQQGPAGYEHEWDFVLATTFPRIVVPLDPTQRVGDVEVLRGGVVLVVENTAEDEASEGSEEEDEE
ncbi:UBX (ubiquitin regulatory X) domain protein [Ceratobasidium sp. AG-Ba]|nr:UBX (ubiquitin regulatory X) domain protein [Ceratobasidium sp. AG-Ba]QRW07165.1 UBX (ubiquitin regulatory X) domain protein [Ceratobasidium sp. AG-Ba]